MFKFLHTADIHLDSPLLNLDNYDDVPREEFRGATRRAFDNIVALAIREEVRFVLIAGDLYDGDCSDFNTPLYFRGKMEELAAAGIRVFVIQGNHDAAGAMQKAFRLSLPDNVHLFATDAAETVTIDELRVAIHGQGFAQKVVTEDLSRGYPDPVVGYTNIGVLHSNCGSREGHDAYAPSTPKSLSAKGYQYWALGHIHKPQTISGPDPWIIYSGNPQGRHIRETGERGCIIATVDGDRIDRRMHTVDVLRWYLIDVSARDCSEASEVVGQVLESISGHADRNGDLPLAIRVRISDESPAHHDLVRESDYWRRQIRDAVLDRFSERVWVEKIRIRTRPVRQRTAVAESPAAELIADLRDPRLTTAAVTELQSDFEKALSTLPYDPRVPADHLDLTNEAAMAVLAAEARELLVARILSPEAVE